MTGAQYIVDCLIKRGVTDAFGIPGGVILSLLYEFDNRKTEIEPHLSYHEQCAGFSACGYAQASGKLGVAYATRGPGFTNLITAIADAYYDSLPVLFITAHSAPCPPKGMRIMVDQEMDSCSMVNNITKKAVRLDDVSTFTEDFDKVCNIALSGRKGPVLIDVSTRILSQEVQINDVVDEILEQGLDSYNINDITNSIRDAKRPVILAGDGLNQVNARVKFRDFCSKVKIPVISSRFTHDILEGDDLYYGYIGSHGMRCSNFILSKTDLILSLGNRLHFPPKSESFGDIVQHARIIRCEIDKEEFNRELSNTLNLNIDIAELLDSLDSVGTSEFGNHQEWVHTCNILRSELLQYDNNKAVNDISELIKFLPSQYIITNDVGNNEFWVSKACVIRAIQNRVYYSKSFGALGCGLGKAIGAYYATKKPVICFVGDQGLQMNIQELQFIRQHTLPICVVVINNQTSGMIKDRESAVFGRYVHTTKDSGYQTPSFEDIAEGYGLPYARFEQLNNEILGKIFEYENLPMMIEIEVDESDGLLPNLPRGYKCNNMQPGLPEELHHNLSSL